MATVEITGLASLAHVLAGGRMPSTGFLLAFGVLVFGCALLTIGRVLRVAVVVPFVLLAQVGLHGSLDGVHAHAHAGASAHGDSGLVTQSGPMLWAHLATAVVTAIVLLLQERALAAVTLALRVRSHSPAVLQSSLLGSTAFLAPVARRILLATSPRRGPPQVLCATS